MRAVRRAAVLVLLGLILGASWAAAAEPRSVVQPQESRSSALSAFVLLNPLWRLVMAFWDQSGCTGDTLGHCVPGASDETQAPAMKDGCTIDPLGRCKPG